MSRPQCPGAVGCLEDLIPQSSAGEIQQALGVLPAQFVQGERKLQQLQFLAAHQQTGQLVGLVLQGLGLFSPAGQLFHGPAQQALTAIGGVGKLIPAGTGMKCYSDVEIQSVNGPEDDGPKDTPHEPQDQEDFLDEEPLEEAELDDTLLEEDAQDEDALEEVELEEAGA